MMMEGDTLRQPQQQQEGLLQRPDLLQHRPQSQSTRSLQQLYRQSQALSGSWHPLPPPAPAASLSMPSSSSLSARCTRTQSWASDLSLGEMAEWNGGGTSPALSSRRPLAPVSGAHTLGYIQMHTADLGAYCLGVTHAPQSMRPVSSTPSFEHYSNNLGSLDVSDPWGFSYKDVSPYDRLVSGQPMPALDPPAAVNNSPRSYSFRSVSTKPSILSINTVGTNASDLVNMPRGLAYPERKALREARLREEQASGSATQSGTSACANTLSSSRSLSRPRPRASSTTELPRAAKARGRSNLAHVKNSEEEPSEPVETPHKRRFKWLFNLRSSKKPPQQQKEKQPSPPQPTPPAVAPAPPSQPQSTPMLQTSSSQMGYNTPGTLSSNARTPPLSTSASSVRSSSVETHTEEEPPVPLPAQQTEPNKATAVNPIVNAPTLSTLPPPTAATRSNATSALYPAQRNGSSSGTDVSASSVPSELVLQDDLRGNASNTSVADRWRRQSSATSLSAFFSSSTSSAESSTKKKHQQQAAQDKRKSSGGNTSRFSLNFGSKSKKPHIRDLPPSPPLPDSLSSSTVNRSATQTPEPPLAQAVASTSSASEVTSVSSTTAARPEADASTLPMPPYPESQAPSSKPASPPAVGPVQRGSQLYYDAVAVASPSTTTSPRTSSPSLSAPRPALVPKRSSSLQDSDALSDKTAGARSSLKDRMSVHPPSPTSPVPTDAAASASEPLGQQRPTSTLREPAATVASAQSSSKDPSPDAPTSTGAVPRSRKSSLASAFGFSSDASRKAKNSNGSSTGSSTLSATKYPWAVAVDNSNRASPEPSAVTAA